MIERAQVFMSLLGGILLLLAMVNCTSAPQTTRLQASDFDETITAMVQSISSSAFLKERSPQSPPAWVTINKVQNLTTDVIPPSEQWMLVARVQSALPLAHFREAYNVRFQITPERHEMLRREGFTGELSAAPTTTHTLSATFMDASRAGRQLATGLVSSRRNFYYLEYSLFDLASKEVVWTDRFEISREATGLAID